MSSNPIRDLNQIYLNEVSADAALRASKKADVERGKAAAGGDREKAQAKAAQASRLYKKSGEKRKSEPVKQPDRSYPKGKGATYKEGYDSQKKKEVLDAMKRQGRKLSDKDKDKIANKVVASKGDTSKSDDRYAYEELQSIRSLVEKLSPVDESVGSAIDKGLGAVGDTAKVAGKAAKGSVKVASTVAKGTGETIGVAAGTPIGVAKATKKGWKKGTQAESVGTAVDKGLGAVGDTAKVAGKTAKGSVSVVSKVAKGAGEALGQIAGTPVGVAKSVKKGWKKGTSAESVDPGLEHNLAILGMISEKEVKVKDTKKVVDAIRAYDKSKDASDDATYDSDEGDKEKAKIEKEYAAKERGEIDKDDPNWKKKKYHTGIHGEEVEALVASGKFSNEELINITNLQETDIADIIARLERKRISKGGDPDESPLGKETGRAMKDQQDKQRKKKKVKEDYWIEFEEGYQRNPEKGEEEERKRSKRIPGERTPMPPRGDKKREEFERWYAANVR